MDRHPSPPACLRLAERLLVVCGAPDSRPGAVQSTRPDLQRHKEIQMRTCETQAPSPTTKPTNNH